MPKGPLKILEEHPRYGPVLMERWIQKRNRRPSAFKVPRGKREEHHRQWNTHLARIVIAAMTEAEPHPWNEEHERIRNREAPGNEEGKQAFFRHMIHEALFWDKTTHERIRQTAARTMERTDLTPQERKAVEAIRKEPDELIGAVGDLRSTYRTMLQAERNRKHEEEMGWR